MSGGFKGALTPEQSEALQQLKSQLNDSVTVPFQKEEGDIKKVGLIVHLYM